MTIIPVGPDSPAKCIADAVRAAGNGDTIRIQAGTYENDFCTIGCNVTLQAVGGRAVVKATASPPNGKGIFTIGTPNAAPVVRIDGLDFTGAAVPDRNGAGIRHESGDLTLTNCTFRRNENGILATPLRMGAGSLIIDRCEFADNGFGDGYTHNIYCGNVCLFSISNSYSHDCNFGHLVKSRADNTLVSSCRLYDNGGTSSYAVDCPNGGNLVVVGNEIQQGTHGDNPTIITYGVELNLHVGRSCLIASNTIVNDARSVTLLVNRGQQAAVVSNNLLWNIPNTAIASGPCVRLHNKQLANRPMLDARSRPYDTAEPGEEDL